MDIKLNASVNYKDSTNQKCGYWTFGVMDFGLGGTWNSLQKLRVDILGFPTDPTFRVIARATVNPLTLVFPPDPIARATVSYIDIIREWQGKENGQTVISDDLSVLAPLVGLEPTTP